MATHSRPSIEVVRVLYWQRDDDREAVVGKAGSPIVAHRIALASCTGVAVFVVVCTAAQFLRSDLDWMQAPLSFYLIGPGGWIVKLAYVALSVSLVGIGTGFHRSLGAASRDRVPMLLFVISAVALTVTAISDTALRHGDASLHARIHLLAAGTTFVCVTTAMLLQSLRLREDARWRPSFVFAFVLAIAAFAALWIYATSHVLPKGLMQKIVILLIIAWLGWAAFALWCRATRQEEAGEHSA